VLENHLPNLTLDIAGLIPDRDLGETRQIDQGQGENVGRDNAEVDRSRRDAGILSNLSFCFPRDFVSNFGEVVELLSGGVKELSPLVGVGLLVVGGINLLGGAIALRRTVDELENKGTSGNDTGASG
jgi:hypothetical protein